jgi:protein transport protein SEC31
MKLRSFDKTATVAWSASPTPYLAMGTAAGALDASFSASTELALVDVFNPSIKASTTASAKYVS